jgi:threonine dehydratase
MRCATLVELPLKPAGKFDMQSGVESISVEGLEGVRGKRNVAGASASAQLGEQGPRYKLRTSAGSIKTTARVSFLCPPGCKTLQRRRYERARRNRKNLMGQTRLSLDRIHEAAAVIDPVFCNTPQFVSDGLSQRLGMRILCKVECLNPIRSFKGRGTSYWCYADFQPPGPIVTASAGNFGQGLAYASRQLGHSLIVFVATNANGYKVEAMRRLGADVRFAGGDLDGAKCAARAFAHRHGYRFVEDGREPALAEGAGTIALELSRWPEAIDAVLVPVGNGALINGIGCWMKAHAPSCRVVGVCAMGAPAMAESWKARQIRETVTVNTIADGIAVRVPVPEALAEMARAVDEVVLVSDENLREAMCLLHDELALAVEPAGAAGIAACLALREKLAGRLVAVPICGSNLSPEQVRQWLP